MSTQPAPGDSASGTSPARNRSAEPRIALTSALRRVLSPRDIAELMAGRLLSLSFDCFVCGLPGDARTTPASVVVWTGGRIAGQRAQLFALAHAHCADSGVRRGAPGRDARWEWPLRWRRARR